MKRLLYIILYMVLAVHASAQMRVTGRVIDLQNKPVSDVIVKMVSGTKTLAFTSTNAKGEYALELKSATSGEVSLQFIAKGAGDQGGHGADSEGCFAEGGDGKA